MKNRVLIAIIVITGGLNYLAYKHDIRLNKADYTPANAFIEAWEKERLK